MYMKLLIILVSIAIIICCAYFNSMKEGLTNKNYAVLIGDSILNNSAYVAKEKSVPSLLKSKMSKNLVNVAKNEATIADLYSQLDKIPLELNDSNTFVFISAGGNDILNKKMKLNDAKLTKLFDNYMAFLKALRVKLGSTKINVLNLYLPSNPSYQSYKLVVDKWNTMLNEKSATIGETFNVVDIHSKLTSAGDFVYDIEPSEAGSVKIANAIYMTK